MSDLIKTKIALCLARFDFGKVADVMNKLNWEWAKVDSKPGTPTIDELWQEANRLLEHSLEKRTTVSCGGLSAKWHKDDCHLVFELEEADSYID